MNIESGYYYVLDRLRPGKVRIVEFEGVRIYDGRQLLAMPDCYEVLGPVPQLAELESLVNEATAECNPVKEQTI